MFFYRSVKFVYWLCWKYYPVQLIEAHRFKTISIAQKSESYHTRKILWEKKLLWFEKFPVNKNFLNKKLQLRFFSIKFYWFFILCWFLPSMLKIYLPIAHLLLNSQKSTQKTLNYPFFYERSLNSEDKREMRSYGRRFYWNLREAIKF